MTGKVAVITGSSQGIGFMIAEGLVRAGARVIVNSRRPEGCDAAAARLSELGWCRAAPADIGTEEGVGALVERVTELTDSVSILINNAGFVWSAPFDETTTRGWDKALAVNLQAPFELTRRLHGHLKAAATPDDPARIINIGSIEGLRVSGLPIYSYAAAKAGLHHLTRLLARELGPENITVNAIAPGTFPSKMTSPALETRGEELLAETVLGRLGRADDVVGATRFLASRAGSYVTGVVLPVDGGVSTCW